MDHAQVRHDWVKDCEASDLEAPGKYLARGRFANSIVNKNNPNWVEKKAHCRKINVIDKTLTQALTPAVESKQVAGCMFVVDFEDQGFFLPSVGREQDLDGIVDIAVVLKQQDLPVAGSELELGQFLHTVREGDFSVPFVHQKLADHLEGMLQTAARKYGAVHQPVAGAAQVVTAFWWKILPH